MVWHGGVSVIVLHRRVSALDDILHKLTRSELLELRLNANGQLCQRANVRPSQLLRNMLLQIERLGDALILLESAAAQRSHLSAFAELADALQVKRFHITQVRLMNCTI